MVSHLRDGFYQLPASYITQYLPFEREGLQLKQDIPQRKTNISTLCVIIDLNSKTRSDYDFFTAI
jgi:hypothetical protein